MKEAIIPCVPVYTTTSFLLRKKSSFVLAEADKMDWSFLSRRDACMYVGGWVGCLGAFKKKKLDAVSILVLYYLLSWTCELYRVQAVLLVKKRF